jgi:hypothetical protein
MNFWASAVRLPYFPDATSFWPKKPNPITPVEPEGQPIYFTRLHPGTGIVNVWSWDRIDKKPDEKNAQKLLVQTLSNYNKDPHNATQPSVPIEQKDVLGWSGMVDYFPRLTTESLMSGWFDQFNKLQGQQKTFYASGLNAFETVEFAIRAGQDVASSYF